MSETPKPILVISKCLGFEHCRWDGEIVTEECVEQLKPYVECRPVCPEMEIGLGCPRDPIRIVLKNREHRLIQPATGKDLTDKMMKFSASFLENIDIPDGFILKFRSPSCGMYNVKLFSGAEKTGAIGKTRGFFGGAVLDKFSFLPIEDEGRLKNFSIREHFLTTLFTLARFRHVKKSGTMKDLVRFQSDHKLLLMSYNQKVMKILGKIVANHEKKPPAEVFRDYESSLYSAFAKAPRFTSSINVLMHAMGYFSKNLNSKEKIFFLDSLEKFRIAQIPLSVPVHIVKSWIVRFDQPYLKDQVFFEPYPEELVEITDSGQGRKLKK
ncbi:DUF523 and DUF1722 domain-containing protein [Candidatus Sumerlaeota bacterium]|nr:DUF523 and DUF1722 domain-containing protein [Candidatus Sumerlaeota bacterium]